MGAEAHLEGKGIHRILVAIDSSNYAPIVIQEAAKLAIRLGSDVTVLNVVNVPGMFASEGEVDSAVIEEEEKQVTELHKKLIEKYFNHASILIESKILHGDPAQKICEYAEAIDADLVIVGTHGRGKLASALMGSVSEKVIHHCKRSVTVIRKSP
jgi:nucleotide-binding universal stress UspA family protein